MKVFILIILCLVPLKNLFAQNESFEFMQKGVSTSEKLFGFLETHPCEIGMDKKCERPLSPKDIMLLKNTMSDLEEWRKIAFDGIVPMSTLVVYLPSEVSLGEKFSIKVDTRFSPSTLEREKYLKIVMGTNDPASSEFMNKVLKGTATNLLLYDGFFRLSDILGKAKKLRSIFEYDMPEEGSVLENTYSLAQDEVLWDKTTYSVKFLEKVRKLGAVGTLSIEDKLFDQYIRKSFVFGKIVSNDIDFRMERILFSKGQMEEARIFERINRALGKLSQIFGNTVGMFQSRDGKLKSLLRDPAVMKDLKKNLKPLDVLLEKTPFRLTDHFIPGYFGHSAIWLGSPEELQKLKVIYHGKEIPLLSHPDVLPHLEKLSQGKLIVEALRVPGVTMNTLEHFMDIDDLVILEGPELSLEMKAEHILKAFQQVGKPYDFNFDVETEREIVCSELIYTVFTEQVWPTSVSMGRNTIGPDQVAWKAVDSCFNPKLMYLSGKKVTSDMKKELKKVLELPGGIDYKPSGTCAPNKFFP